LRRPIPSDLACGALAMLGLATVLVLVVPAGPARAACSPTQQQEADLAYATASEFLANSRWLAAIPSLESALSICPEHETTLQALARVYREAGDVLKARADSLDAAGAATVGGSLRERAGSCYGKSRDGYARLLALKGQGATADDYSGQALTLVRLKDYAGARAAFLKARLLSPDDCNVLTNLALLHYAVQDFRNSVSTYEEALSNCPDQADKIYPRLADACKKAADKETKIGNATEAKAFNDKYQEYAKESGGGTTFTLAVSKMRNKQYSEAVMLFQQILAEMPTKKAARLNLARCYLALGQHEQAAGEYRTYLQADPNDERVTAELVESLTALKRCTEAQTLAQEAITRFMSKGIQHLGRLYYAWGDALECTGDYAAAKERFRLAGTANDPQLSGLWQRKMERQDQLIVIEQKKREQRQQGG